MSADHLAAVPSLSSRHAPKEPMTGSWAASHDPRWLRVAARLRGLRQAGRRSVRIVDADCGAGGLLLHAAAHARSLGFVAIEVRGIDRSPALIGRARAAAARCSDPAIGARFEVADMVAMLGEEQDFPADILLCRPSARAGLGETVRRLLLGAGDFVVSDVETSWRAAA